MRKKGVSLKQMGIMLLGIMVSGILMLGCTSKKSAEQLALEARVAELEAAQQAGQEAQKEQNAVLETMVAELTKSAANTSSSRRYLFQENFTVHNITEITGDDSWGGSYTYLPNIGFSAGKRVIYDGSIPLLDSRIPDSALAVLNKAELRVLRNTIYAKYGMIFQSNDLTVYFQQFGWYSPRSGNVEALLTDVDKANIGNIQIFENAAPNLKVSKRDLVSDSAYIEWYPVPSWSPELKINNDNTIEKSRWDNEDNWKGTYRIENGFLVVYVTEQGVSDYYSKLRNWQWPGGVTYRDGKITYREPIQMVFPIGDVTYLYSEYGERKIGSTNWF